MKKTTWKTITIIWAAVALIGLASYIGGLRPVNAGAFIFPGLLAAGAFAVYRSK